MKKTAQAVLLAGMVASAVSHAESSMVAGVHLGLLGPGLDLGFSISDKVDVKLGFNSFTYGRDGTESDIDYDMDLKLRTAFAQADWHPAGGGFFLAGGLYYNGNKLEGTAKPSASYDIAGTTYTAAQVGTLSTKIDFNTMAPYLGLGWGAAVAQQEGFSFRLDLGVLYQGSPNADLTANGLLASDPTFQADLQEEERQLQDAIDGFRWYPVVQLGVSYAF